MKLLPAIEDYISLKCSLGFAFSTDARILRSFGRALGELLLDAISSESCDSFCRGTGPLTRNCERKHQSLRGFFKYLVSRGYLTASPLPEPPPRIPRTFRPYIYSHDELQALFNATDLLANSRSPLEPLTVRPLLLTLYSTGLRPSEALRLRCCDVDLSNRVLTIWNTKFFKSRLVPFGADLCKTLEMYLSKCEHPTAHPENRTRFFATRTGKPISLSMLEKVFVRLRDHAGIRRSTTDCWQPRLHDLRHTFAVHRLIAWYREGVDVQARLPLLATYLGHVNLAGTQHYLTMTPELLAEASQRFERYASITKEENND